MIEMFCAGALAAMCFTASVFFLRYWSETRDSFFLAFAASFIVEGLSRVAVLFIEHPNEGNAAIYTVRLIASLLILAAILQKNYER